MLERARRTQALTVSESFALGLVTPPHALDSVRARHGLENPPASLCVNLTPKFRKGKLNLKEF